MLLDSTMTQPFKIMCLIFSSLSRTQGLVMRQFFTKWVKGRFSLLVARSVCLSVRLSVCLSHDLAHDIFGFFFFYICANIWEIQCLQYAGFVSDRFDQKCFPSSISFAMCYPIVQHILFSL